MKKFLTMPLYSFLDIVLGSAIYGVVHYFVTR